MKMKMSLGAATATRLIQKGTQMKMKMSLGAATATCLMLILSVCSAPFIAHAQQHSVMTDAKTAAEHDAEADVNKLLWFGAGTLLSSIALFDSGCLVSTAGLGGSYLYQPSPPSDRFLGKSPEYVAIYTTAYKSRVGSLQLRWAAAGCAGGGLIIFGLIQSTFSVGFQASISLGLL